jgi:hypothetical protein
VTRRPCTARARAQRRTWASLGAPAALALVVAGCGRDDLARPPDPAPGVATWAAVWLAGALVVVLLAATLTWPLWRRRTGSRAAVVVLGLQAGAMWLFGALAFGAAVRTEQLSETNPDPPVEALIGLGRVGDADLARLLQLAIVILVLLPAVLLTISARFAGSDRVAERVTASVVLALQVGAWGVLLVRDIVTGDPGASTWLAAVNLPLTAVALSSCWPGEAMWDTEPADHRSVA